MDIYFCDSCAARVSDADLHRGHGIKRGDVVICGDCIDQGLGKDLLAQAGSSAASPVPTQPSSVRPAGRDPGLDYEEHDIASSSSAPLVGRDGVDAPLATDGHGVDETDAMHRTGPDSDDIVSAAGGFAALHGSDGDASDSDIQELLDVAAHDVSDEDQPSTGIHPDPLLARNVTDPDDDRGDTSGTDDLADALAAPPSDTSSPAEKDAEVAIAESPDDADEEWADEGEDGDNDEIAENVLEDQGDDDYEDAAEDAADDDDADDEDDDYEDEDYEDDDVFEDGDQDAPQSGVETAAFAPDDYPDATDDDDNDGDDAQTGQPGGAKKARRRGKKRRRIAASGASKGASKGAKAGAAAGGAQKGAADKLRVKRKGGGESKSAARSNGSSRRATTKGAAGKGGSSRRAPAKKKNNTMLILVSLGSALLISIVVLLLIGPVVSSRGGAGGGERSELEQVSVKVKRAHDLSISAQRSDNPAELQEALRAFEAARDAVLALENNLPEGWTEDDYHNQVRRVWRFHDLNSQAVNLRNRIGIHGRRDQ